MIAVLAEYGGQRLLGKARELADYQGTQVVALCSDEDKPLAQRYISLGADEVRTMPADNIGEWIEALVDLVKTSKQVNTIILPSNVIGDLILGAVSARVPERIGSVIDGAESLSESGASKTIPISECSLGVSLSFSEDRVSILSLKLNSFPEPFEDTTRYGKVISSGPLSPQIKQDRFYIPSDGLDNSSSVLVILKGKSLGDRLDEVITKVASKYKAYLLEEEDLPGRVIYGNCLAVDVSSFPDDLPQINEDLISINRNTNAPITKLANLAILTSDIEGVLASLVP